MKRCALLLGEFLIFSIVVSQFAFRQTVANPGSVRDRLMGTWELISTEERLANGTKRPYQGLGPHGKGYLMYAAHGHMCAELMNPDRPKWKKDGDPTPQEKASAFEGFTAYCGRFEVDEAKNIVYHLPDVAWRPGYLGTRQVRPYSFDGDLLTFSGKVEDVPGVESYAITWKKMK